MRVLLIEDDNSTVTYVKNALAQAGIVVDVATSGSEGYEYIKLYDYNVLLLDLMLCDKSGYDVLARIRSSRLKSLY